MKTKLTEDQKEKAVEILLGNKYGRVAIFFGVLTKFSRFCMYGSALWVFASFLRDLVKDIGFDNWSIFFFALGAVMHWFFGAVRDAFGNIARDKIKSEKSNFTVK